MGLCARCVGVYSGFVLLAAVYVCARRRSLYSRIAFLSWVGPLSFGVEQALGGASGNAIRLVVGVALGVWLGVAVNWLLRN